MKSAPAVSSDTVAIVAHLKSVADKIRELGLLEAKAVTEELDYIGAGLYQFPIASEYDEELKALVGKAGIEDWEDAEVLADMLTYLADLLFGYKAVKEREELVKESEEMVRKGFELLKKRYPKLGEVADSILSETLDVLEEIKEAEVSSCASLKEIGEAARDFLNSIGALYSAAVAKEELPVGQLFDIINDVRYKARELKNSMTPYCVF